MVPIQVSDGTGIKDKMSFPVNVNQNDMNGSIVTATIGSVETSVVTALGQVPVNVMIEPQANVGCVWQTKAATATNAYYACSTAGSVKFTFFA
jgi:hypothetical protein